MPVYALNLFNVASRDEYLAYSRRSAQEVQAHGGKVIALGKYRETMAGDLAPRLAREHVAPPSQADLARHRAADRLAHPRDLDVEGVQREQVATLGFRREEIGQKAIAVMRAHFIGAEGEHIHDRADQRTMSAAATGSTASNGSSSTSRRGACSSAQARPIFFFMPAE